jgi:HAD superfamily hydrolase (TIGR01549 family)
MAHLRAVIFDVDGTLIDSNDAHARAWADALRDHGYDVPVERIRRLIGMGGDKLLPEVSGVEKESDLGKKIDERRQKIFNEQYLPTLHAFPKVRALVQHIQQHGLKAGIASSAKGEELGKLLKVAQIDDLVEAATSSSDAKESKPDPDIVQAAIDKLGCPVEQVIMVGDTPYDVEAAQRAGIQIIAVRCGGWDDDGLQGAVAIYDSPADLLAHYDQSPLAAR